MDQSLNSVLGGPAENDHGFPKDEGLEDWRRNMNKLRKSSTFTWNIQHFTASQFLWRSLFLKITHQATLFSKCDEWCYYSTSILLCLHHCYGPSSAQLDPEGSWDRNGNACNHFGASGNGYEPGGGAPLEICPTCVILQVMMVEVLFLVHFCGARWWRTTQMLCEALQCCNAQTHRAVFKTSNGRDNMLSPVQLPCHRVSTQPDTNVNTASSAILNLFCCPHGTRAAATKRHRPVFLFQISSNCVAPSAAPHWKLVTSRMLKCPSLPFSMYSCSGKKANITFKIVSDMRKVTTGTEKNLVIQSYLLHLRNKQNKYFCYFIIVGLFSHSAGLCVTIQPLCVNMKHDSKCCVKTFLLVFF